MKKLIVILCFAGFLIPCIAQTIMEGDASARVDRLIKIMPSTYFTNEYAPLNYQQETAWALLINQVIEGNITGANSTASTIGYKVIQFTDIVTQRIYYFVEKHPDSSHYWGTLVFNPNPLRSKLFIQSPHPLADQLTGSQGFNLFESLGAFIYCVSGAHRCNSSDTTNCSGHTDVCGLTHTRYPVSDQSHSVESLFQVATEVALSNNPQTIIIQVHGFSKGAYEPDYVMSNGTEYPPTVDYLSAVRDSVAKVIPFLKFKIIHEDTSYNYLTATTNTQGRAVNGSLNPCSLNATSATGRFLHIEQARGLRNPEMWYLLRDALSNILPPDTYRSVVASFTAELYHESITVQWETSLEKGIYGFELQRCSEKDDWSFVAFIAAHKIPGAYTYYDNFSGSGSLYYRLKQINTDGTVRYLPAAAVSSLIAGQPVLYDNYPNPFNSTTIINFDIPRTEEVELAVYNVIGEKITTLKSGILEQGTYKVSFDAGSLPAGVYFYRLSTNNYVETKKLVVLK